MADEHVKRFVRGAWIAVMGLAVPVALMSQVIGASLEMRIGSMDGPAEETFYQVYSGKLVADGFWIVHRGDQVVRKYALDGSFVSSLGGKGSGPGEFERLVDVALDQDRVFALDGAGRITVFGPMGAAETHRLRELPALIELYGLAQTPMGLRALANLPLDPRRMGTLDRDSVVLLAIADDWSVRRVGPPVPSRWWRMGEGGGGYRVQAIEDGPIGLLGIGPVGAQTSNDGPEVTLWDTARPDRHKWTEATVRSTPGPADVGGRFFDQVVVGEEVWVSEARTTDGYRKWWLISEDGETRGSIRLPERTRVLDADGRFLLARSLDELDVERIELWRLTGVPGR